MSIKRYKVNGSSSVFEDESGSLVDYQDYAALEAKCAALVAENGQMLRLLTDISENHLEYLSEGEDCMMAGVPLDYVSEINAYVARDVEAENPFKETDVFLAEVRAQGVDMAACALDDVNQFNYANMLDELAQKLRKGASA